MSPYFDGCYFDGTYFDASVCAKTGGAIPLYPPGIDDDEELLAMLMEDDG